jgi:hypothetical protein
MSLQARRNSAPRLARDHGTRRAVRPGMNRRRLLATAGLAAAVLASIATSAPVEPQWELDGTLPLGGAVSEAEPDFVRQIVVALTGPAESPAGSITVHVDASAAAAGDTSPTSLSAELRSDRDPERANTAVVVVEPGGSAPIDLFLPAWEDCPGGSCEESFTLTITRTSDPFALATALEGTVFVDVYALGAEVPPDGTQLRVNVVEPAP